MHMMRNLVEGKENEDNHHEDEMCGGCHADMFDGNFVDRSYWVENSKHQKKKQKEWLKKCGKIEVVDEKEVEWEKEINMGRCYQVVCEEDQSEYKQVGERKRGCLWLVGLKVQHSYTEVQMCEGGDCEGNLYEASKVVEASNVVSLTCSFFLKSGHSVRYF